VTPQPVQEEKDETPPRVWQVVPTARRPQAPAWIIGTLVHEAIALWRFPNTAFVNTALEKWVKARASGKGLTDERQLSHAVDVVGMLLERFQKWERFPEISSAERRFHELPYSREVETGVETGFIDLLYRYDGRWTIIDFKTDEIRDESTINGFLVDKGYVAQIERYGTAVTNLLGERPQLIICLLNGPEGIILVPVNGE
jgi:ATP-dependent exoDNAse (exonuclease V) beta subunit